MTYHEPHRAPADILDGIYCKLIRKLLTLRPEHAAALRARGLTDEWIAEKGYCSTPRTQAERDRIAGALSGYFDTFGSAPGFFYCRGRWQMASCAPGFLIPSRAEDGRVQALCYRLDRPRDGVKYCWLSSNPETEDDLGRQKYPRGASSGAPFNFVNRPALWGAEELTVVEGVLKADCVAALSGLPVVGIAGVNNTRGLAARLRVSFPRLRRVYVAFDRDVLTKPQVAAALERLIAQLEGERFAVRVRMWPGESKGFDDYLFSELLAREVAA
jgi:hypothetical protein